MSLVVALTKFSFVGVAAGQSLAEPIYCLVVMASMRKELYQASGRGAGKEEQAEREKMFKRMKEEDKISRMERMSVEMKGR